MINKEKNLGQIFTPVDIVNKILDKVGYKDKNILNKKILEPSFGKGVFLFEIVKRLINYCESISMTKEEIKEQLENNVYGIEIDEVLYKETLTKLNLLTESKNIRNVKWKMYNQDALIYTNYNFFDFVVGNPPYIRVHNLSKKTRDNLRNYDFTDGTTDMYIIFFGLGIKFLNKEGKLGYITPNSYMKNTSQSKFRKYLIKENLLEEIVDYGSSKLFDNADTYTAITILNKNKDNYNLKYSQVNNEKTLFTSTIDLCDFLNKDKKTVLGEVWNFSNEKDNNFIKSIKSRKFKLGDLCNIQYGIATNKDSVYIVKPKQTSKKGILTFKKDEKEYEIEEGILKKVVKGSVYEGLDEGKRIIFPYTYNKNKRTYEPLVESVIKKTYPLAYKYLCDYRKDLEGRSMDKTATTWYQYARSQGLKNTPFKKLVFKHVISSTQNKIKVYEVSKSTVVYSGIFITSDNEKTLEKIKNIIETKEFYRYALLVGKDMSGGYKNISSKNIKKYRVNKL